MNPTHSLTLREHVPQKGVELSHEQAGALGALTLKSGMPTGGVPARVLDVNPESARGYYTVRPNSIVGSVRVGELLINILPKAGVGKAAYMLARAISLANWAPEYSMFEDADSLVEAIVPVFLREVDELILGGLGEDYVLIAETGSRPRGRFRFNDMARRALPLPASYEYDDFTIDVPANQLLLAALSKVSGHTAISPRLRGQAKSLTSAFTDVSWMPVEQIQVADSLPPAFERYGPAMSLAWLICHDAGIETQVGARWGQSLLFDMNRVFEAYLTSVLRQHVPAGYEFDPQAARRPLYLDRKEIYRLKPDLIYWRGGRCQLVGDIKYKLVDTPNAARSPDLYQVATYGLASGASERLLFYVGSGEPTRIDIVRGGGSVEICPLDVEDRLSALEERVTRRIEASLGRVSLPEGSGAEDGAPAPPAGATRAERAS